MAGVKKTAVQNAVLYLYQSHSVQDGSPLNETPLRKPTTGTDGKASFAGLPHDDYYIYFRHHPEARVGPVEISDNNLAHNVSLPVVSELVVTQNYFDRKGNPTDPAWLKVDDRIDLAISGWPLDPDLVTPPDAFNPVDNATTIFTGPVNKNGRQSLDLTFRFPLIGSNDPKDDAKIQVRDSVSASDMPSTPISGKVGVTLSRIATEPTKDLALWAAIRKSTEALSFKEGLINSRLHAAIRSGAGHPH